MPWLPKRYRPPGYKFPAERKAELDRSKLSSHQRGYGAAWRKLRALVLMEQPVCAALGCANPATEVDHIVPRARGGTDDRSNLQGLCKPCHSRKTAREDGRWG